MLPSCTAFLTTVAAVIGLGLPLAAVAQEAADTARVIVKFSETSPLLTQKSAAAASPAEQRVERAAVLSKRLGLVLQAGADVGEAVQVVKAAGLTSQQLADQLAQQPDVEYAVPDRRRRVMAVPNDPLFMQGGANGPATGQWYLRAPDGVVRAPIDAAAAWDITTGRSDLVVAVLDTGVRFEHPDLLRASAGGKLLDGYDLINDTKTANDGDGRDADASDPGDADTASECSDGEADNSSWHGTEVAGILGALSDNGVGMAGTAWRVKLLPVRVLGKCGGFDSDILAGMRWAAGIAVPGVPDNTNPARVINMSLGGTGACTQAYRDAVQQITALGVVIVASAGNGAGQAVAEPANCPGVIGVAGVRHIGTKVGFSNLGPEVSIAAPSGNCVNLTGACLYPILTTSNTGTQGPGASTYTDSFNTSVGTSFSAPLVAGAAALVLSVDPSLTPAAVRDLLRNTGRPFPTTGADANTPVCAAPTSAEQLECYCTTNTCGAGLLDAGAAVRAVLASVGVLARIVASPTPVLPNQSLVLDASSSPVAANRSLAGFAWEIVDGGGIVAVATADTSTFTVTPSADGRFTVRLTVTDNTGATSSVTEVISVGTGGSTGGGGDTGAPSNGGGGGGAMGAWLLLALLAAAMVAHRGRHGRE